MKKMTMLMLTLVCILTLSLGLTGCGSTDSASSGTTQQDSKPALCFVVANTANAQGINFNSPLVQDTVTECALNYGFVTAINADGESEVLIGQDLDIDEKYKHASPEKLKSDAIYRTNSVISYMQTFVADDSEIDFLESLRLACRTMSSLEGYTSKTIIVLGTGLSTTGYMNFGNNLISADAAAVADLLEERQVIPDFSGISTIYWQGLGDVAAPQTDLSPAQRSSLQDIWIEVIRRGGGELVANDFISAPADQETEYPSVSVVDLPAESPVRFEAQALETEPDTIAEETAATGSSEPAVIQTVKLEEDQVTFVGDEAVYLNPDEAVETIRPIAEFLLQYDQVNILLAGTTAGDEDSDFTFQLSKDRADAVRNTLIELGVNADRIKTLGLGCSNPWHVWGAGYEGTAASGNRAVVLMDASSEHAKELLKQ